MRCIGYITNQQIRIMAAIESRRMNTPHTTFVRCSQALVFTFYFS